MLFYVAADGHWRPRKSLLCWPSNKCWHSKRSTDLDYYYVQCCQFFLFFFISIDLPCDLIDDIPPPPPYSTALNLCASIGQCVPGQWSTSAGKHIDTLHEALIHWSTLHPLAHLAVSPEAPRPLSQMQIESIKPMQLLLLLMHWHLSLLSCWCISCRCLLWSLLTAATCSALSSAAAFTLPKVLALTSNLPRQ